MNDLISKSRLKNELLKIPSEMGLIEKAWVIQAVNEQKIQDSNNNCNCQHNSNSRDNDSCCICDSRTAKINKTMVNSLEIIVRMIDNKPYYEIKYKKVGEDYYHVGYSSFNIDNVLKWRDECFELVDVKVTNADRIRNMSDEELADTLFDSCLEVMHKDECHADVGMCKKCISDWLQSEAE